MTSPSCKQPWEATWHGLNAWVKMVDWQELRWLDLISGLPVCCYTLWCVPAHSRVLLLHIPVLLLHTLVCCCCTPPHLCISSAQSSECKVLTMTLIARSVDCSLALITFFRYYGDSDKWDFDYVVMLKVQVFSFFCCFHFIRPHFRFYLQWELCYW